MQFLESMIQLLYLSVLFFCSHIYALRSYPVARISSGKLKEILPNALVVVQNVYGTYVARWRKFEIP